MTTASATERGTIMAIARRDLITAFRSPGVVAPMIIVPVVFSIVLPLASFAISKTEDELPLGSFVDLLPDIQLAAGASDSAHLALALARFVLPTLLIVVPLMVVSVLASDSIAGENERGTLEGLLLTPASNREIFLGKVVSALAPAMAVHLVTSTMYAVMVNLLLSSQVEGLVLPTWSWLALIWFVGPAFAVATLGLTVIISARADSVAAANQISAVAILPILLMVIGQVGGVALLSGWLVLAIGLALTVGAAVLMQLGARSLDRDRLVAGLR